MLAAGGQRVAERRVAHAVLALVGEGLPPQGRVVGVPGLVVGVVAQGVRVDLAQAGLAVVPGEAAVDGVGPLLVQAHGVQGQAALGRQLRQVPPLAVEVIVDFVSWGGTRGGQKQSVGHRKNGQWFTAGLTQFHLQTTTSTGTSVGEIHSTSQPLFLLRGRVLDAIVPGFHTCTQNPIALEKKTVPAQNHSGCADISIMRRSPVNLITVHVTQHRKFGKFTEVQRFSWEYCRIFGCITV